MAVRKIRDKDDARTCLEAAEASGQSRRAWARANGVDGRSLHCWYLSLRGEREKRAKSPPPLQLVELVPAIADRAVASSRVVLRLGEVEIEVESDFDEATLGRVLGVVRSC